MDGQEKTGNQESTVGSYSDEETSSRQEEKESGTEARKFFRTHNYWEEEKEKEVGEYRGVDIGQLGS